MSDAMWGPDKNGNWYPKGPCSYTAGFWDLLFAKLFGKKYVSRSGPWEMVAYWWRGRYYITRYARWQVWD